MLHFKVETAVVSAEEATFWLTLAGESDVDVGAQDGNRLVTGVMGSQEYNAYFGAKEFIALYAKDKFVDSAGKEQTLFTTINNEFYKPLVNMQYRNDPAYRDFYWNATGVNLAGDKMTPEEQAVYDRREVIAREQKVKDLALVAVQSLMYKAGQAYSIRMQTIATERAMNEGVYQRIEKIPPGQRPAPETYLSKDYIDAHLADFTENGVVRFTSENSLKKYGTAGPDGGFVFPKNKFDELISQANGNMSVVEKKLGLPSGYLSSDNTVALYIKPVDIKGLKIPSGNEPGVLPNQWIPGGYTKGGMPEAVMDFSYKPPTTILKLPLKKGTND